LTFTGPCSVKSRTTELFKNVRIKIFKTTILNDLLCETASLTLREEHTVRVFSKTGCWGEYLNLERVEVTGGWRKLHNEELRDLYKQPYTVLLA
jgi:hypothetical protein